MYDSRRLSPKPWISTAVGRSAWNVLNVGMQDLFIDLLSGRSWLALNSEQNDVKNDDCLKTR